MRVLLGAACLGVCLLVAGGATAQAAVVVAPPGGVIQPVQDRGIAAAAPQSARPPVPGKYPFHPVPAGQVQPGGISSPTSPLFIGRGQTTASAAPAPRAGVSAPSISRPLVTTYNGLVKPGIGAADNGFQATPPDSTGAIGPNHYVEMANSIIHVWDRSLNNISSMKLPAFFKQNPGAPVCDPQVQWDPTAQRWLAMALFCNISTTSQGFFFSWSKTADPSDLTNGWCPFTVRTDPLLFDYPKLGHNSTYMIFGGNFYDETTAPNPNPPFFTSAIAWASLPANGDVTCPLPAFNGTALAMNALKNGDGVTPAFTPVPVNTMTNSGMGFIVSSYDVGGNVVAAGVQSKLAVWHLDAVGNIIQNADVAVAPFSKPTPAAEAGTTNLIDTLDGRITQAVGDPANGIWTQHTVANGALSKVTWYELTGSGGGLALTQSGDITNATDWVFNGAVSPSYNALGTAVEYSRSGVGIDPVIAAQVRVTSTPLGQMAPGEAVIASSAAADKETLSCANPNPSVPCRWGDYSGLTYDPVVPQVVWGTNMIITAPSAAPAWQNENFALWAAVPPLAPTIGSASAGDRFACVNFTPALNTADGGVPDMTYTIRAYVGAAVTNTVVINAPAARGCIGGLIDGTVYTLTVSASNVAGNGPESMHSAPVTPTRGAAAGPGGLPSSRSGVHQAPANPPKPR